MTKKQNKKTTIKKSASWVIDNLGFLMFLTALCLIYISNANSAERKMRRIDDLKKEVKEAKYNFMKVKQEIMHPTTESELAKQLEEDGFKVNRSRPIVLKPGQE